jgi:squalene/oxidosqualene cyclase-like protein
MTPSPSTVKPVIPTVVAQHSPPELKQQVERAMRRALSNLSSLQEERGSWAGDYGGPMFLLPMYVALAHATGQELSAHRKARMSETFFSAQRPDGSIGLHSESTEGSMFCTSLGYVALRILGQSKDAPRLAAMRKWIAENGTPLGAASWGKFTLCLLGLYDWKGIHAVQPELWLLPRAAPMHPGNLWCHCRQVYLPMSWLYARRATAVADPLIIALRDELYGGQWAHIEWEKHKDGTTGADDYRPLTPALRAVNATLDAAEKLPFKPLRKRALEEVYEHILYEDRVTQFIDIGPVNKVLNTFVHHFHAPRGETFQKAWDACEVYLWEGHDGLKMQGYNNSEFWDTVFTMQAIAATPFARESGVERMMQSAYVFLRENQIQEDVPEREKYFRDPSKGGWPFSNRPHGWPITDCTAEGLRVSVALEGRYSPEVPTELLRESV